MQRCFPAFCCLQDLDYVGPWNTTYAFTLTAEDILIKQNYYLLDGAPTVSYEYFRRAGE